MIPNPNVVGIAAEIFSVSNTSAGDPGKLESDEFLTSTDLICEGPIAGLVDSNGNLLKFLPNKYWTNIILGKGVYYNNVPLIDSKLNKFNFVTQGFNIFYGSENNENFFDYPSTVFNYRQNLLLNERNFEDPFKPQEGTIWYWYHGSMARETIYISEKNGKIASAGIHEMKYSESAKYATDANFEVLLQWLKKAKNFCNPFIHEIKNKFADEITINISIDQLYNIDNSGNTKPSKLSFVIEVYQDDSSDATYVTQAIEGISKSSYVHQLVLDINQNPFFSRKSYIRIYPLTQKISYSNAKTAIVFGVASIIERVKSKGKFYYPYSAVVKSSVSSKHFKNDPDRSFDLKLLKIKVPNNYQPEAKTYSGNWDGNFSNFLRWTDNPAWIFYDICTNNRYGIGNGKVFLEDLNKWELYKIGKYCDELVVSTSPRGTTEDQFFFSSEFPFMIFVPKYSSNKGSDETVYSLNEIRKKYRPMFSTKWDAEKNKYSGLDGKDYTSDSGASDSVIFLYDSTSTSLSNDNNLTGELKNRKKMITNIIEVDIEINTEANTGGDIFDFQPKAPGEGSWFAFFLIPYIDPSIAFEKEQTGNMLKEFELKMYSDSVVVDNKRIDVLESLLFLSTLNTQNGAINHILNFILSKWTTAGYEQLKDEYVLDNIFPEISRYYSGYGKCLPRVDGYRDPLEPRFTANVLINNETECLKLLNDLASIFRGLTYYRNNLITTTIDVSKPIAYMFNNTNVKDGLFTYSTGSVDGNYSVAKVLYKDKYNKFEDEVEIVEDSELIKEYGVVSKEILGFGVTSRDQARRMGLWLLATNRFENGTVSFVTDMQGIMLKPGDVIQIEDSFRSDYLLQGRVVSVDRSNKYIIVDRKIDVRFTGSKIKFLCDKTYDSFKDISTSDQFDAQERTDVIELFIERIENNTNRIYIQQPLNFDGSLNEKDFSNFYKIMESTPFIIQSDVIYSTSEEVEEKYVQSGSLDNKNLYKIVSIGEQDVNEYSIFAVKFDRNKYLSLDNNIVDARKDVSKRTVNYSSSQNITELDLSGMNSSYYDLEKLTLNQVSQLVFDYSFSEDTSPFSGSKYTNYSSLNLKFGLIKNFIQSRADAGEEYYIKVNQLLSLGGGFLCKIISKNQSIRFKVPVVDAGDKVVFLGAFPDNVTNVISSASSIKIYIYDVENKIIEV